MDYETILLIGENIGSRNGFAIVQYANYIAYRDSLGNAITERVGE